MNNFDLSDVETKWSPPEGFFKQSAKKIAEGLKANSKDKAQAMRRLTFYINRAGSNLSDEDKKKLELAKTKLRNLYEKGFAINKNFSIIHTDDPSITQEMQDYFENYLFNHIKKVAEVAHKLYEKGYIAQNQYQSIDAFHDYLKWCSDEYAPYVKRKWQEKSGAKFSDYKNMDPEIKAAIEHHVIHSTHHPECYSNDFKGLEFNKPCHVNNMPELCVVEMICDWKAMADEFGNTLMDWFNKTDGTRWIWDESTRNLILKWIKRVEEVS